MKKYSQLSKKERRQIHIFLNMGYSIAQIIKKLSRHRSTIYREIARNKEKQGYFPVVAQEKAEARKRQCWATINLSGRDNQVGRLIW